MLNRFVCLGGLCAPFGGGVAVAQSESQCPEDTVQEFGRVDINDLISVLGNFGATGSQYKSNISADVDLDGNVDGADIGRVMAMINQPGKRCPNDFSNDGKVNAADLTILLATPELNGSKMGSFLLDWGMTCEAESPKASSGTRKALSDRTRVSLSVDRMSCSQRKAGRTTAKNAAAYLTSLGHLPGN